MSQSSVACHWCDLCSTRIQKHAWRCKLCDFDLCCKCASRSDAAEKGENVLRSDSGLAKEEGMDNSVYFKRAIQLASSESWIIIGAFALLTMYCGTQIALPFYQGHIIDYVSEGDNDGFVSHIEVYLGIMAVQGLLSALYSAVFAVVSRKLVFHVRNTLFEQVVNSPQSLIHAALIQLMKPTLPCSSVIVRAARGLVFRGGCSIRNSET